MQATQEVPQAATAATTASAAATAEPQAGPATPLNPATRPAWTVEFVLPAPHTMPSERLRARAELIRQAGSCNSY